MLRRESAVLFGHLPALALVFAFPAAAGAQADARPAFNPPASQWAEGTSRHDDGATRDYYNRAGLLAWRNRLGDWRDATGVAQGPLAYGAATWIRDSQPGHLGLDVTALVREWVAGTHHNDGLLLRGMAGNGTFHLHSREQGDPARRPWLLLLSANGAYKLIPPTADVHLDASTYQGNGDQDKLVVSGSRNTLLHFDLSKVRPADFTTVYLVLYSYAEYGTQLRVGAFRCEAGPPVTPGPPLLGLAARFPRDRGIETDPGVHLFAHFDASNWQSQWSYGMNRTTLQTVASDPGRAFVPWQGAALRVRVPAGQNTGMSSGYRFAAQTGGEPTAIYFRYYLRIAADWVTEDGGKFPGIAGTYGVAGWGGRPSNGSNGWSARGAFRVVPPAGNPLAHTVPVGSYVYHADMTGTYGDHEPWHNDYLGFLQRNRWYCIEQYLRMNTPAVNDGVLRVWIDGRMAYERTDWRWRDVASLKIEQVWMNVYHGGTRPVGRDVHLYIDNVVIADRYIGPMVH